jgi:hypothetical protein
MNNEQKSTALATLAECQNAAIRLNRTLATALNANDKTLQKAETLLRTIYRLQAKIEGAE